MARGFNRLLLALVLLTPFASARAQIDATGLSAFPALSAETDWPWWRGPSRNGVAVNSASVPVRFGESENVLWRAPVPGRGHSSPIVVGDRVFLATADESSQVQSVLAYDRKTGKQLWKTDVNRGGFASRIHPKNTYASPTVACDGQRVIAVFANHDTAQATALDLNGKKLWQQPVGPFDPRRYEYGYGPSPVLYKETVIVAAEADTAGYITALDRKAGKKVWRTPRPENISYSTPSIAHVGGRDQMIMSGADHVVSYDPATGKQLWSAPGTTAATCGTAVWDGDTVFCSGGYPKSETVAVRADGTKQVLWTNSQKCYEQSMLAYNGYVYALTDNGGLFCWRASDGEEMWRQRLKGPVSASPVLAGGHIYWANELGTMYVFQPNSERCELVAENRLGDESFASPAVAQNCLFLRVATSESGKRQEYLYCIGK
jgi:outer membrane protein assembly factor BamB